MEKHTITDHSGMHLYISLWLIYDMSDLFTTVLPMQPLLLCKAMCVYPKYFTVHTSL